MGDLLGIFSAFAQLTGLRGVRGVASITTLSFTWKEWEAYLKPDQFWVAIWGVAAVFAFSIWISCVMYGENSIRNGRFRERTEYWGSGYLEDEIRDGTVEHTNDAGRLPYRAYPSHAKTRTSGEHSMKHRWHWWGKKSYSYRFSFTQKEQDEHWGSLCQRIYGLKKNTPYVITYYSQGAAENDNPKALFITASLTWEPNEPISGSTKWKRGRLEFLSRGDVDYTEIRFVIQDEGTFWITDVSVKAPFWRRVF